MQDTDNDKRTRCNIHEAPLIFFFVFIVFAYEGDRLVDVFAKLTCIAEMYIIVNDY